MAYQFLCPDWSTQLPISYFIGFDTLSKMMHTGSYRFNFFSKSIFVLKLPLYSFGKTHACYCKYKWAQCTLIQEQHIVLKALFGTDWKYVHTLKTANTKENKNSPQGYLTERKQGIQIQKPESDWNLNMALHPINAILILPNL